MKKTAKRPKLGGENTVNGEVIVFFPLSKKSRTTPEHGQIKNQVNKIIVSTHVSARK